MRALLWMIVVLAISPRHALADWFYPAVIVECDETRELLTIRNASAYNEAGIRTPDETRGIYVPKRESPEERVFRCKTKANEFVVKIAPYFGNLEAGDGFELAVVRNGTTLLQYTPIDDDPQGLRADSYLVSIVIPATGEPIIQRSCQAHVHIGSSCTAGGPNNAKERTRKSRRSSQR